MIFLSTPASFPGGSYLAACPKLLPGTHMIIEIFLCILTPERLYQQRVIVSSHENKEQRQACSSPSHPHLGKDVHTFCNQVLFMLKGGD